MKLSTSLAPSVLLATTAQACVRIYVDQVLTSDTTSTQELFLWDQDKVSKYHVPYIGGSRWSGNGYFVRLDRNNEGYVEYPNGNCKSTVL